MSKQCVNTFSGGIDRDTSVNKYDNTHYYDAKNIRPISNDTFRSGAVSNVDGLLHKINFTNATLTNSDLPTGAKITSISVYNILTVRNKVVFFAVFDLYGYDEDTTSYITNSDINGILSVDIDSAGDFGDVTINYATGTELHFSKDMSSVCRYENQDIQNVYWVTGSDPLRIFNVVNTNIDYISDLFNLSGTWTPLDPVMLDHVPNVTFSNISIDDVVSGGSYTSGAVQYSYQLYDKNGTITTMSPVSNPVLLSKISESKIGGSDIDEDTNKSVQITIEDLDTNFSRIRIIALFYDELNGTPDVNIVFEGVNSGSITFVDTGEVVDTMTYEEFTVFNNTVYEPGCIDSKDNILFAANVKESTFQSDAIDEWDSRAYVFTESSTDIDLYNDDGTTSSWYGYTDIADFDYSILGEEARANSIGTACGGFETDNLYYKQNDSSLRMYQFNSTTFGGEGPNVKFTYTYDPVILNGNGYVNRDPQIILSKNGLNFKTNIKGLQPNEVYRFGIVFFNNKGQSSYVKWIQDIRIPYLELLTSSYNTIDTKYDATVASWNVVHAYQINVVFTIKTMPDDDNITSWQIVRVKRDLSDREVIYNGVFVAPSVRDTDEFARTYVDTDATAYSDDGRYYSGLPLESAMYVSGGADEDHVVLWEFLCPEININGDTCDIQDKNVLINYYQVYDSKVEEISRHAICTACYKKTLPWQENFDASNATIERYEIVKPPLFTGDPSVGRIYTFGSEDKEKYMNLSRPSYSSAFDFTDNVGIGGTKAIIYSDLFTSTTSDNEFPDSDWDLSTAVYYRSLYGQVVKDVSSSRYGGFTHNARQLNTYISYGKVNDVSTTTDATDASEFNGDTYIKTFVYLRNIAQEDYPTEWSNYDGLQELLVIPIHTSINLDYRNDDILKYITLEPSGETTSTGDLADMWVQETVELGLAYQPNFYDESIGDLYVYNSVYSKENDALSFYPKPFDFTEDYIIDTKVIASNEKSNGEYINNWSLFKADNFIEVDSKYGGITDILNFKNNLYCFQTNAVCILAINDRSLISDESGATLALGTGGILDRYDYITSVSGLQNKNSLIASKNVLYFIDEYSKELVLLDGKNYKDLGRYIGFSSKLNTLIPSTNILTGFDPNFNEIYLSFDNETWVYNELTGSIIGKFDVNPEIYFNLNGKFYSVYSNILRLHNYENSKLGEKSYITLLINPNSNIINTFSNLDIRTDIQVPTSTNTFVNLIFTGSATLPTYTIYDYNGDAITPTVVDLSGTLNLQINEIPDRIEITGVDIYTTFNVEISNDNISFTNIYTSVSPSDDIYLNLSKEFFDNDLIEYELSSNTVDRIKYSNSYISEITKESVVGNSSTANRNISSLVRAFRTQVPLTDNGNRFVDSYILVTFEFDNNNNSKFLLHDIITYYNQQSI